jgi:hypothetical protein
MNTNLVIRNNEPRLVELPEVAPKIGKTGKVTAPGYMPAKLLPGENDLESDNWDAVKGNPAIKIWLATRTIENMGPGKARSILAGLDKLAPGVAARHIGNCENVVVLNEWKGSTENLDLLRSIDERILELVHSQDGAAVAPTSNPNEAVVDPVVEAALED